MGQFVGTIGIAPAGGNLWKVLNSYAYITNKGERIDVPVDFLFDGASVPRLAWIFIGHPLDQKSLPAAGVHDLLYRIQTTTRYKSDKIFLEALKTRKVNLWKRQIMFYAVRLGGGKAWKKHQEN